MDSSTYPAEYGTGTGGQITVIGKRGDNGFHGSWFHFLRNDALDAPNFFDAAGEKSKLRLNQFGGSLGGRLIRDKVVFFGSDEGLRQRPGLISSSLRPRIMYAISSIISAPLMRVAKRFAASFIGDMSATGGFRIATGPITTITRDQQGLHNAQQSYF